MNKIVKILAIETSADETSAAVFTPGGLKSNIIYSQIAQHTKTGGIVPEVAARAHLPKIIPAIKLALAKAKLKLSDIDAIAVTAGPGLAVSLRVGVDTAKALAFALDKPIIPINHLEGHLLSALPLTPALSPLRGRGKKGEEVFPALGLIVSGGHTMLVLIKKIGQYKIIGETVDDAAGECFDKVAKILGLPYPGGPALARLAEKGNPRAFNFPRPMINQKNYNFSFAGLKTAVLYKIQDLRLKIKGKGQLKSKILNLKSGIAASAEQAIVDVLAAKTIRAAREFKVKTVLLGGGVAANKKLRIQLRTEIKKHLQATSYKLPPSFLTTDNAGMIALAAYHHFLAGHKTTFSKVKADPNLELKSWRK